MRLTAASFGDGLGAAFFAMARRLVAESALALACPPLRPSSTAALFLPFSVTPDSSISPVAIFMTVTAFEITSAGRCWPFGPFGIAYRYASHAAAPPSEQPIETRQIDVEVETARSAR